MVAHRTIVLVLLLRPREAAGFAPGVPATVLFANMGRHTIQLDWVPPEVGRPRKVIAQIPPGREYSEETITDHRFELHAAGVRPMDVRIRQPGRVAFTDAEGYIHAVQTSLRGQSALADRGRAGGPAWERAHASIHERCHASFKNHSDDEAFFCHGRFDNRVYLEAQADTTDDAWSRAMQQHGERADFEGQQQMVEYRNFTEVGFKVVPEPPSDVLAALRAHHRSHRLTDARPEDHPALDPYLSGRESDTWMLELPWALRMKVEAAVRPMVSAWSKIPEGDLHLEALYGIRLYHNGSVLHMHVDRAATHVLSAIWEVEHLSRGPGAAEGGEHWPLTIFDHAGREHQVPNRRGQIILYESAICPHGRPVPFSGREFANIFVHFRPKGWPAAYRADHALRPAVAFERRAAPKELAEL